MIPFSEVPLGEEFYDEWDNLWEKRSEREGMSWFEYEEPTFASFSPDDKVRLK